MRDYDIIEKVKMTHDELLAKIDSVGHAVEYGHGIETSRIVKQLSALRAVVELHKPEHSIRGYRCKLDGEVFPCKHHQVIEKELK